MISYCRSFYICFVRRGSARSEEEIFIWKGSSGQLPNKKVGSIELPYIWSERVANWRTFTATFMGSMPKIVHYCCVSRGNRILYAFSGGDRDIENLAGMCLEKTPEFHAWYFETFNKRTFGFLIEDGYVYFAIVDEGLKRREILQFLGHVRDEFKKAARKSSRGSLSSINSVILQEKLVPVIRQLINSLEHTSHSASDWPIEVNSLDNGGLSPSPSNLNGQSEAASSTKAPLLGRNSTQDKKKNKDHILVMRDVELDEHRKSTDRGVRTDSAAPDSINQGRAGSTVSLQKDLGRNRSSVSQSVRKKWWRHVRIVLMIDAAVCAILFFIWLTICLPTRCMR